MGKVENTYELLVSFPLQEGEASRFKALPRPRGRGLHGH